MTVREWYDDIGPRFFDETGDAPTAIQDWLDTLDDADWMGVETASARMFARLEAHLTANGLWGDTA